MENAGDSRQAVSAQVVRDLSLGWLYTQTIKNLNQGMRTETLYCASHFFTAAYHASVDQALAILARLLAQTGVQGEPSIWALAHSTAEGQLQVVGQRVAQLIQARAQAMRQYILDPDNHSLMLDSFSEGQIEQLEACYQDLIALVDAQKNGFAPEALVVDVQDDVEFLGNLLAGGCI